MTPQMLRSCDEYFALAEANASEAARRAGYSKKRAGITVAGLLVRPEVGEYLARKRASLVKAFADRHRITLERVMEEDALIGSSDIGDMFKFNRGQLRFKTWMLYLRERHAIAAVNLAADGSVASVKLWHKGAALTRLARAIHGLPVEAVELNMAERAAALANLIEMGTKRKQAREAAEFA